MEYSRAAETSHLQPSKGHIRAGRTSRFQKHNSLLYTTSPPPINYIHPTPTQHPHSPQITPQPHPLPNSVPIALPAAPKYGTPPPVPFHPPVPLAPGPAIVPFPQTPPPYPVSAGLKPTPPFASVVGAYGLAVVMKDCAPPALPVMPAKPGSAAMYGFWGWGCG